MFAEDANTEHSVCIDTSMRPPTSSLDDGDAAHVKRIIMEQMINPPSRVSSPYTPPNTPDRGISPERDNYNVDKITECWVCGNSFDSRKSLLCHLKEHNTSSFSVNEAVYFHLKANC